jgi:hypothetical protein
MVSIKSPSKERILQALDDVFSSLCYADETLHERWRSDIMDTLKQNMERVIKTKRFPYSVQILVY